MSDLRAQGATRGGSLKAVVSARQGHAPAPASRDTPRGDNVKKLGVGDFIQQFSMILQEQIQDNPEFAVSMWKELEAYLNQQIQDLENKLNVLIQLRERIRDARENYELEW
jgi:hypothetical protein